MKWLGSKPYNKQYFCMWFWAIADDYKNTTKIDWTNPKMKWNEDQKKLVCFSRTHSCLRRMHKRQASTQTVHHSTMLADMLIISIDKILQLNCVCEYLQNTSCTDGFFFWVHDFGGGEVFSLLNFVMTHRPKHFFTHV